MENKDTEVKNKQKVKSIKNKKGTEKKKDSEEVKKLQDEIANLSEKLLRISADMQNIKRRNEEEVSRLCKYDGEKLILKILPVIDDFERAILLDDRDLTDELSKFLSGFKMIYASLLNTLNEFEVKEIDCKGLEFDPNKMEAVLTDNDQNLPSNVVLEVLQKGYTYKDKVIRVAMVKVNE